MIKNEFFISMISFYIMAILLHPLLSWLIKDKSQKWGNYWIKWLAFTVLLGLILYFLITNMDKFSQAVQPVFNIFGNFTNSTG